MGWQWGLMQGTALPANVGFGGGGGGEGRKLQAVHSHHHNVLQFHPKHSVSRTEGGTAVQGWRVAHRAENRNLHMSTREQCPPPPPRGRSLEAPISSCLPELCSRRILSLPSSSPALGCHPTSGFCSFSLLLQQLRSSQPLRAVPRSWKGPRGQNPTSGWDSLPQTPLPPHSRLTLRDADVGLLPAVSRRVDNSCELCSVAAPAPHRDIIFAFM